MRRVEAPRVNFLRVLVAFLTLISSNARAALGQQQFPAPTEATARCRDGTYSFSRHHSGTCSHHGGVDVWLDQRPSSARRAIDTVQHPSATNAPNCGGKCGVERWPVKTLSDPERQRVKLQPIDETVEDLVLLPRPGYLPATGRADPVEVTVYRVKARLISLFTEADGDYHLVLASPNDPSITMIAEVPDPECSGACASGFVATYAQVRKDLMDHLNAPGGEPRPLIHVTGVGFFDYLHGQLGVAPNGIELHPVLKVEFP